MRDDLTTSPRRGPTAAGAFLGRLTSGWDRFWFSPSNATSLGAVRVVTGLCLLYSLLVYWLDLAEFLGPQAWVDATTAALSPRHAVAWSYLFYLPEGWPLHLAHALACCVALAFSIGLWTRVTAALAFLITLSYYNRIEVMAFGFDSIMLALTFYLALSPCGDALSVDAMRRRRRAWTEKPAASPAPPAPYGATIGIRLVQLHTCLVYAAAGFSKHGASWKTGSAIWRVIATTETQNFDHRSLTHFAALFGVLSQATVLWETYFCVLIWSRTLRPYVLLMGFFMHLGIGTLSVLSPFSYIMMAACCSFLDPDALRRALAAACGARQTVRLVYDSRSAAARRVVGWVKAFDLWDQIQVLDADEQATPAGVPVHSTRGPAATFVLLADAPSPEACERSRLARLIPSFRGLAVLARVAALVGIASPLARAAFTTPRVLAVSDGPLQATEQSA